MRAHVIDYIERDGHQRGKLLHRGGWFHDLPRLMPLCRLLGHRPVVDGTGTPGEHRGTVARWVVCDRCGVRPQPQGALNPDVWDIGQPYTGRFAGEPATVSPDATSKDLMRARLQNAFDKHRPGPWPARPTGTIGAEVVIGRTIPGASVGIKVGNRGSEHVLAASVHASPLGYLDVHTEGFGQGVQRRLNPKGYDSRVIEVSVHGGRLYWKVWAKRDEWSRGTPRWQDGSIRIDLRDVLLGERRYTYEPVQGPVDAVVRMPEGDDHQVQLTLKRARLGRPRGRRAIGSWAVEWESKAGIRFRNHDWKGDEVFASGVQVSPAAVEHGRWAAEACAKIAAQISADRSRYGWRPRATETEAS